MIGTLNNVTDEVKKVVSGKEQVIDTVLMAIIAGGHILLEDVPGVGKTTMALAFSKAMGLKFNRVQFTPDVVPSDITGFTMLDNKSGDFSYVEGAAMCNFFLADEINRTSSKTQSALLEAMQESKITVDGQEHVLPKPFIVLATENPMGTAGTQMLPEAQLDRFMVKLSMGYPDFDSQVQMLSNREKIDPLEKVETIVSVEEILEIKEKAKNIFTDVKIYEYVTALTESTRNSQYIKLGISPRGALSICAMAKAAAFMEQRDFVLPEDVRKVFIPTSRHRIILSSKAQLDDLDADMVLREILDQIKEPSVSGVTNV